MLHRDRKRHLHICCSLGSFFFLSPLVLSHFIHMLCSKKLRCYREAFAQTYSWMSSELDIIIGTFPEME